MSIHVSDAQQAGRPITRELMVKFQPNALSHVRPLSDRLHRPYPASDLDDPDAMLLVYDAENVPARIIPRAEWSFAKLEDGRVVADACDRAL